MTQVEQPRGSIVKNSKGEIVIRFSDGSGWRCIGHNLERDHSDRYIGWDWANHPSKTATFEILCDGLPDAECLEVTRLECGPGEAWARARAPARDQRSRIGAWVKWADAPVHCLAAVYGSSIAHGDVIYRSAKSDRSHWVTGEYGIASSYKGYSWYWPEGAAPFARDLLLIIADATGVDKEHHAALAEQALASELIHDRWKAPPT